MSRKKSNAKLLYIGVSLTGLLLVYVFQQVDLAAWFKIQGFFPRFVFNRTVRFVVNDLLVLLLIYALFREKKYILFALLVQAAGLIFVLLPYFFIKYHFPHYNGPLVSFLHRLVFNPLLMLLLIPAFYLQQSAKPAE
jgi:exosortase F-associated protein